MDETKEEIEYMQELRDMRPEDVLEFLYNQIQEWNKEEKNPIEKIKEDLKLMIATLKEDKFERMQVHFRLM